MSERNGDKARFHKNRKRKVHLRQRLRALLSGGRKRTGEDASGAIDRSGTATSPDAASLGASRAMQDEGGPTRAGD
jgi:hypothetical protein